MTLDARVAVFVFGAAAAIGLVFAFVGLDLRSLWFDELFTARLLTPWPDSTLLGRIATDVHPPVYLLTLAAFTRIVGDGETGLRLLSALAASGAIVVFVAGTRSSFSLPARLFAAAIAAGSLFWFTQSQNARSYALCLLLVTGILSLALARLQGRRGWRGPALVALVLIAAFTHFYALYASIAVLMLLGLLERRDRRLVGVALFGLVTAAGLYITLVIKPLSQVSLGDNWYRNDPGWYLDVLGSSLGQTLGPHALVALALCLAAALYGHRRVSADRTTLFLAGVPLLVLLGAITTSTLVAPNFWDRNFLVVSPFLWALLARAYDGAVGKLAPALRLGLIAALSVLVVASAAIVMSRLPVGEAPAMYEPFRESAAWIRAQAACRDQPLPVVTTDSPSWYKPGYAERVYDGAYGYYLRGFAPTVLVFGRDLGNGTLPAGLKEELQRRLAGEGCPVLAWSAHNMSPSVIAWLRDKLIAAVGTNPTRVATQEFSDGSLGYVLYVARPRP